MNTHFDMNQEFTLHRHHNGVQLRRPSPTHNAPFLPNIMNKQFSVFFINTENAFINANDHVLESTSSPSLASLKGNTYHHICRNATISEQLHANNKMVMTTQKTLFFDEDCSYEENEIKAICAKMPWYNEEDKVIGVFAFSYLSVTPFVACNQAEFTNTINEFFAYNQPSKPQSNPSLANKSGYSARETELIHHLLRGKTIQQSAMQMNISVRTAEHYCANIKQKAGVKSRSALIETLWNQGFQNR